MRERGSIALCVTVVLLCLVPAATIIVSLATTALSAANTVRAHRELADRRLEVAGAAAVFLSDHPIPYGVHELEIPTRDGPIAVAVVELGSRFPVYSIPIESVPGELWTAMLLPGASIADFEAARTECSPSLNTEKRFAGVVAIEIFNEFFTPYARDAGPWEDESRPPIINVNTAPVIVLEAAIARTGVENPARIAQQLDELRRRGVIGATELAAIDPSGRLQTVLRDTPIYLEISFRIDETPVTAVLERDTHGTLRVFSGPREYRGTGRGSQSDR